MLWTLHCHNIPLLVVMTIQNLSYLLWLQYKFRNDVFCLVTSVRQREKKSDLRVLRFDALPLRDSTVSEVQYEVHT